MKRRLVWLILSCSMAAALLLSSCGPADVEEEEEEVAEEEVVEEDMPQYGGTLNLCGRFMSANFSPFGLYPGMIEPMYEPMMWCDYYVPEEEFERLGEYFPQEYREGALAESWEMNDPYTVTIKLREGVHWFEDSAAAGREVVAEDIKWFYETFLAAPASNKDDLPNIDSMECTDRYTIVFHLMEARTSDFLKNFEGFHSKCGIICAPDPVEAYGEDAYLDWRNACGTGAWQITDFVDGSSVTYTKNDNYWGYDKNYPDNKLPYMDYIVQVQISDYSTRLSALRTGHGPGRGLSCARGTGNPAGSPL